MLNVSGKISDDKLVITIDLSQEARAAAAPSKSGKTRLLASTGGFVRFGDVRVGLNCIIQQQKD